MQPSSKKMIERPLYIPTKGFMHADISVKCNLQVRNLALLDRLYFSLTLKVRLKWYEHGL